VMLTFPDIALLLLVVMPLVVLAVMLKFAK